MIINSSQLRHKFVITLFLS